MAEIKGMDDIPEIETEEISDDVIAEKIASNIEPKEASKEKSKEVKEEIKEEGTESSEESEEIIESDESIEEESEEELEEEIEDEEVKEVKEEIVLETSSKNLRSREMANKEYLSAREELRNANRELNNLYLPIEPTKPDDEYDESAMRRYELRMVMFEEKKADIESRFKLLDSQRVAVAKKNEVAFREDFKGINLDGFEKWLGDQSYGDRLTSFVIGSKSLYSLYNDYLYETGNVEEVKKVNKLKNQKVKFKPTELKSSTIKSVSGNKYKYANMPQFKEMVADFKKLKVSELTGKPYTMEYIDELCKSEFVHSRR